MSALMPRLFGDMTDWFEMDFPLRAGHMIPVENADEEHVNATYAKGVLEVKVPLTQAEPAGRQIPVTLSE